MTEQISIGGEDEEGDLRAGLVTLVLALVEIVDETLEREAVRRMQSGQLSDEEIERLGNQLRRLNEEIAALEEREGVADQVEALRGELDDAVGDVLDQMTTEGSG